MQLLITLFLKEISSRPALALLTKIENCQLKYTRNKTASVKIRFGHAVTLKRYAS